MTIAFFGSYGSFNYHKIGGVDAIVRRLANGLSVRVTKVLLLRFGAEASEEIIDNNIHLINVETFESALSILKNEAPKYTIVTYLPQSHRSIFKKFQSNSPKLKMGLLLTVYHDNTIKRWGAYLQATINKNYQHLLCISDRIHKAVSKLSNRSVLLLPPIDDSFYNAQTNKTNNKINIGFLGRLDKGKGADVVIDYFEQSELDRNNYSFSIYSYPWKNDADSMLMHNKLLNQKLITYIESKVSHYTPDVDKNLAAIIDSVDIFYLPYRTLSTTIDSPLVPLEILSRGKIFITTDEGIMKTICPLQELMVSYKEKVSVLDKLIVKHTTQKHSSLQSNIVQDCKTSKQVNKILNLV